MSVEIQIKASAQGSEVTASTGSVADAADMGKLVEATALPVRLLDQAVVERFGKGRQLIVESRGPSSRIVVISVGKDGINFVNGSSEVISQLQDVLSLLHNSVIEFFTGKPHFLNLTLRELGEPCIWVPAVVDGLEDTPKKVPVRHW